MDHRAGWIREKAATSLKPSQVETTLVQLDEQWPANAIPLAEMVEQFPLGEAALLHLLAVSSICATRLARNPEIKWKLKPEDLAASVQTPCVAIFAARNKPRMWFPYGGGHRVLYHRVDCWGCGLETCTEQRKKCILSITVDEVIHALREVLPLSGPIAVPSNVISIGQTQ